MASRRHIMWCVQDTTFVIAAFDCTQSASIQCACTQCPCIDTTRMWCEQVERTQALPATRGDRRGRRRKSDRWRRRCISHNSLGGATLVAPGGLSSTFPISITTAATRTCRFSVGPASSRYRTRLAARQQCCHGNMQLRECRHGPPTPGLDISYDLGRRRAAMAEWDIYCHTRDAFARFVHRLLEPGTSANAPTRGCD